MTTLHPEPHLRPARAWGTARLLAGTAEGRVDHERHLAVHGRTRRADVAGLADALDAVHLLGRGGAAFPVATKLRGTALGRRTHVLVNASEGEPASMKDRTLLRLAPHLVLDGAEAVARALGTRQITVSVHDEQSYASLAAALAERGTRDVRLHRHDHGFVAGEVRALTRLLSGGPALPPGRRVLPTVKGIDDRPTFASNAETFAHVALLLTLGVDEFGSVGAAEEPGTTLATLLGDTAHQGVLEVPTGLPLSALVGTAPGPVLVGGYHGTWLPGAGDLTLSRPALRAAGVPLNAGVLARLPEDVCPLAEVVQATRWLASQSTGQCGPCWFGLPSLAATLEDLYHGRPVLDAALARTGALPGRGACAHPDGSAMFVSSALRVMSDEVERHLRSGACGRPYGGVLPVGAMGGAA